jgi:hypothetical protein
MPGFDGTGPRGLGPMTGGGRGFCAIPLRSASPVYAGMRFRAPYTLPWGIPYYGALPFVPQITRQEELDYLKSLAQSMREDLEELETRIQKIEARSKKKS